LFFDKIIDKLQRLKRLYYGMRMIQSAQRTIRNSGLLLIQHVLQILGSVMFIVWVPRLMGPSDYGRYSLLISLSIWFVLLGSLGFKQIISRFIPQWVVEKNIHAIHDFIGRMITLCFISGVVVSLGYLLITLLWLRDLAPHLLVLLSISLIFRALSNPLFLLFLGLNYAARWGVCDVLRRWLSLVLILVGFLFWGLTGACLAVCLTEITLFLVGILWVTKTVAKPALRLNLRVMIPYLKFGLIFYFGTLLTTAFWFSGDSIVKIFMNAYNQVGFFGLGRNIYFALALVVSQVTMAFAPFLIHLRFQNRIHEIQKWTEHLITVLTIGASGLVFGFLFLGEDLVRLLLGLKFTEIIVQFLPFAATLVVSIISSVYLMLTVVFDKPEVSLRAAGIKLFIFWSLSPFLVAWKGGLGVAVGILIGSMVYSLVLILTLNRSIRFPAWKWTKLIFSAGFFLPLLLFKGSIWMNGFLFCLTFGGFITVLFLIRSLQLSDMKTVWDILKRREEHIGLGVFSESIAPPLENFP
jgi:O-antigen/teichoic acid export membrane protein